MACVALWSNSRAGRSWSLGLLFAYTLACVALLPVPSLFAQDAAKKDAPPAEAPAAEAPPAEAPKADTSSPAADAPPVKKSLLMWAIQASGPIGLFLLCLSVYFTALVIKLFMELRLSEAVPAPPWWKSWKTRSRIGSFRRRTTPAGTTSRSSPDWSGPASPTTPTVGPRRRRRCRPPRTRS